MCSGGFRAMAVWPPHDYIARHDILVGTAVGYRTGDGLYQQVVDTLGLVLGVDVDAARSDLLDRPADSAPAARWRDYALAQDSSLTREQVDDLSRAELIERFPDPNAAAEPDKPARRSTKA